MNLIYSTKPEGDRLNKSSLFLICEITGNLVFWYPGKFLYVGGLMLTKIKYILILSISLWGNSIFGDDVILSNYRLENPTQSQLDKISNLYEIVSRDGTVFEIYVPANKSTDFLKIAPTAKMLQKNISNFFSIQDANYFSGYRNIDEVEETLKDLAQKYPDIVKLERYGTSKKGKPLWVLKVSDEVNKDDKEEPQIMIDAGTHGDEIITVEVLLRLMEELLSGYEDNARLTQIIDRNELYFIPVVNPDGFARRSRYASGVDPNRDFPWPEKPNRNPISCIKNLMDFADQKQLDGSMDIHAYGRMVMYPWAYTRSRIKNKKEDRMYDRLTTALAEDNGYKHGPISTTIYVAKGSSSDYFYWKNGTTALAIEIAGSKAPSSSKIPRVVDEMREMTWSFIEHFQE